MSFYRFIYNLVGASRPFIGCENHAMSPSLNLRGRHLHVHKVVLVLATARKAFSETVLRAIRRVRSTDFSVNVRSHEVVPAEDIIIGLLGKW